MDEYHNNHICPETQSARRGKI